MTSIVLNGPQQIPDIMCGMIHLDDVSLGADHPSG